MLFQDFMKLISFQKQIVAHHQQLTCKNLSNIQVLNEILSKTYSCMIVDKFLIANAYPIILFARLNYMSNYHYLAVCKLKNLSYSLKVEWQLSTWLYFMDLPSECSGGRTIKCKKISCPLWHQRIKVSHCNALCK